MSIRALVTKVSIQADAQGNAPTEIELLRTGTWHTPWHGDFEITLADLHEFAANFTKGVGLVADDPKMPINYAHESWDKAAAWAPKVRVDEDRESLVAYDIEWTDKAVEALRAGEWRYISPEFNPRGWPWEDPESEFEFVENVITGAALTNIPLFKKLKPIMASRVPSKPKKADVTSGDGEKHNQGEPMKLEDILAKQVSDRTEEENTFLTDHQADLTDEQKAQVETEVSDAEAEAKAQADKEAAEKAAAEQAEKEKAEAEAKAAEEQKKVEASALKGYTRERIEQLEADAKDGREAREILRLKEAEEIVGKAVKAGQVKSGDKDAWVTQLLASCGDDRKGLEALLASLPTNQALGKELGDAGADASRDAADEVHNRVVKLQADARAEGKTKSYAQARKEVLAADKELKAQFEQEDN
ncbi:phage protease [Mycolicibacterium sp. S3B2]|uniref:phage protease n=1 Tax=Mycolicibacterium sp. S3B2 TaxID=3415120 RepID=UPI003C7DB370